MNFFAQYLKSSIGKKQIVAATGLILISFVVVHLAGNLFIYGGPEAFNGYAKKLVSLRPGLYFMEIFLTIMFIIHIYVTALIVWENIQARGGSRRYEVYQPVGNRSLATRLMPYTGTYILIFVIWHLMDFTFINHEGPRTIVNGKDLGLYGIVFNAFTDPVHSGLYILAMIAVGMHLTHGVQSFFQTFGFNHAKYTPMIRSFSLWFGILVTVGYSSIPVWVLLQTYK